MNSYIYVCIHGYRLESDISRYQSALTTWTECDKQLLELEMKFKGFGDVGIGGNQKSGGFGSASDSGMSDSGSEHELHEHEKRLVNLKQLANNLMSIMTPGSEALTSILAVRYYCICFYLCLNYCW